MAVGSARDFCGWRHAGWKRYILQLFFVFTHHSLLGTRVLYMSNRIKIRAGPCRNGKFDRYSHVISFLLVAAEAERPDNQSDLVKRRRKNKY